MLSLCYHAVSPDWPAALSATPANLERQVTYLLERGYQPATFTESVQAGGEKTMSITFDDSYRSVIELGLPILQRLGVPATVFVPTRWLGAEEPMSWPGVDRWLGGEHERELMPMSADELKRLIDAGWEIGSHTVSHPRLTEIDDERLRQELEESRSVCEGQLGVPCTSLAYPYGDHDERVVAATARAGYLAACTLPSPIVDIAALRWPRIGVYHDDDFLRFRAKVSPAVQSLRASGPVRWAQRQVARRR